MKKIAVTFVVVLCLAFVLASCGSSQPATTSSAAPSQAANERKVSSALPESIRIALRNVPEDALIGIGTARAASLNLARTTATTRARAEISRQMNTMIQDMVRDYSAGSEVDPTAALSFQENITVALSRATLTGASVIEEVGDQNGYWVVVMLSKTNTVNEINQAQAAAKLAVPAMASFNAEDRMNAAFANAAAQEVGYSGQ